MRVRFRAEAVAEVTLARDWYEAKRTGLGDAFVESLGEVIDPRPERAADLRKRARPVRRAAHQAAARRREPAGAHPGDAAARTRFFVVLISAAALSALVLSTIGLYVLAYVVRARTREIGVRMALGADTGSVRGMVARHALGLAGVWAVIGLLASTVTSEPPSASPYGVSPHDPLTLVGVTLLLVGVAWSAAALPARRAARKDPFVAMAGEE